jgi:hypothetical protein
MKASRILIAVGCAAALIALIWQARTIANLRVGTAELRKDLKIVLDHALANPSNVSSPAGLEAREKLELIKLRHEVRELKENLVDANTRERNANLRTVAQLFLPGSGASGPYQIRPEWKRMESQATNGYAQAMQALVSATNDYVRFLSMDRACRTSFAVGRTEDARRLATDMLALDEKYSRGVREKMNGDVQHNAHMILGRIAVEEGRIDEAKKHLLAAGSTQGSPVLGSFGPSMTLANALLEKGEQEVVLQYFELCRKFWYRKEQLDEWIKDINAGRIPEFRGHLIY